MTAIPDYWINQSTFCWLLNI